METISGFMGRSSSSRVHRLQLALIASFTSAMHSTVLMSTKAPLSGISADSAPIISLGSTSPVGSVASVAAAVPISGDVIPTEAGNVTQLALQDNTESGNN